MKVRGVVGRRNTKRRKENPNPAKDLTAVLAKVSFLLPEVLGQNPEERNWISCRKEGGVWAFLLWVRGWSL